MEFPYNTRLAQSDSVRMGDAFKSKLDLTEKSFMNRATVSFNQLPQDLRKIKELGFLCRVEELYLGELQAVRTSDENS